MRLRSSISIRKKRASACNLPVLTTRFGALPEIIEEVDGFRYYDVITEIPGMIAELRKIEPATSGSVTEFSWEKVFLRYLEPHLKSLGGAR